jgi:hypothetical protein
MPPAQVSTPTDFGYVIGNEFLGCLTNQAVFINYHAGKDRKHPDI